MRLLDMGADRGSFERQPSTSLSTLQRSALAKPIWSEARGFSSFLVVNNNKGLRDDKQPLRKVLRMQVKYAHSREQSQEDDFLSHCTEGKTLSGVEVKSAQPGRHDLPTDPRRLASGRAQGLAYPVCDPVTKELRSFLTVSGLLVRRRTGKTPEPELQLFGCWFHRLVRIPGQRGRWFAEPLKQLTPDYLIDRDKTSFRFISHMDDEGNYLPCKQCAALQPKGHNDPWGNDYDPSHTKGWMGAGRQLG
jgi:hypothetical protein